MSDNDYSKLISFLHSVVNLPVSSDSIRLLLKSYINPEWKWHRNYIKKFLNVGEHRIRIVLKELDDLNVLSHNYERDDGGKIVKKSITIDSRKLDTFNSINHHVDYPHCCKPTHIDSIIYNSNTNTTDDIYASISDMMVNHVVENRHDGEILESGDHMNINKIPKILTGFNQWVFVKEVPNGKDKKPKKIPFADINSCAKVNERNTWHSFKHVTENFDNNVFLGIGFVLTENDPFTIIDLDNCIVNGKINEYAKKIIRYFDSYTELSISKTGIHIVVIGDIPKSIKKPEIEIYYTGRCMLLTGLVINNNKIEDRQEQLNIVANKLKPPKPKRHFNKKFDGNGKFTMPNEMFPEGNRNNELAKWAGILVNKNITEHEYFSYLHKINAECCKPPLPEHEVDDIAKSIQRYKR